MEYHRDEAQRFFPEPEKRNAWADIAWIDWLICIAIGVSLAFAAGCTDGVDASNIAQDEQAAYDKKVALLGMPCTWIAVCIHDPCSVLHRRCAPADLTERK